MLILAPHTRLASVLRHSVPFHSFSTEICEHWCMFAGTGAHKKSPMGCLAAVRCPLVTDLSTTLSLVHRKWNKRVAMVASFFRTPKGRPAKAKAESPQKSAEPKSPSKRLKRSADAGADANLGAKTAERTPAPSGKGKASASRKRTARQSP